ncbi:MAG: hypothetical protein H0X41_03735 [Chitinophagaceae bacterium]|nr:hypothetical protein [Chitinophagaceae bacterium]
MTAKFMLLIALSVLSFSVSFSQNLIVDAGKKNQVIRSIGVNANPQSWNINPKAVAAVLDQLIDSMGCTSFRLMYDDCDWEAVNDNDDPQKYNWAYYDSVYRSPRFAGIWEMIRYLNKKGITDITLSPDGAAPKWMGVTILTAGEEREYAETISSMVIFAKKRLTPAIQFSRISPINETTCGGREGVIVTPQQLKTVYHDIATALINDSVSEVTIIGPDDCSGWAANAQAILSDSVLMSKTEFLGQHDYSTNTEKAAGLVKMVKQSRYPDKGVIMTEVNARCPNCDGGTYNEDYGFDAYAGPAYQYILQDFNAGVNGVQIWEAYDSRYHHPYRSLTWSMWGIFAVNDTSRPDVYSKRPHFNVMKQLYRFVKPGDVRIDVSSKLPRMVLTGFSDSTGSKKLIITGVNNNASAQVLTGFIKGSKDVHKFSCYLSNARATFKRTKDVMVTRQKFAATIPAKSVFTLVYQ